MNATQKATMYKAIECHGRQLLAIFPRARNTDPVALCRALRRWEVQAHGCAEDYCNGAIDEAGWDSRSSRILASVNAYLGSDRVWVNGDPRGYALKLDLQPGEELHRDWGGYGIIAPDFSDEG